MINALVLSLKELLLLKESGAMRRLPLFIRVKVGRALALGETFCLLTVVFEIIIRDGAEHEFGSVLSARAPFSSVGVLRVFLTELFWGFVYSF